MSTSGQNGFTTTGGFNTWKKATIAFSKHALSQAHTLSTKSCSEYETRVSVNQSVNRLISSGHREMVNQNRKYLKTIIESIRFLALQKIGLRGHDESDSSNNRGNFIELLSFIASQNHDFATSSALLPATASYTSADIQNEILELIATNIVQRITSEVHYIFAISVDETKDISKTEQISLLIRYVYEGKIHEEFVGYRPATGLDAESLNQTISNGFA